MIIASPASRVPLVLAGIFVMRLSTVAFAQTMPNRAGMDMGSALAKPAPTTPAPAKFDAKMADMEMSGRGAATGMDHTTMTGAFGPYLMTRESSGTSWQPDLAPHTGYHVMAGGWSLMGHAMFNLVYDTQSGPRGGDKGFVSGMLMGMAQRDVSESDTLRLRAMVSPDPFMGPSGYPLLLATGETANGRTPLVDRQHPHDLFMELSASLSHRLSDSTSVFVYAALPGEPAFGPPAFMHRPSILDSPEAPISHHWLDSTHISMGVLTGGVVLGGVKLEASGFKGREPNQMRYDIERPALDSIALRASWNPTRTLALQGSWARQKSPEQLIPDEDTVRFSASALYAKPVFKNGLFAATLAWGRRKAIAAAGNGPAIDAYVAEATLKPDQRWTIFGRAEQVDNTELLNTPGTRGRPFTVGKASIGGIRDFALRPHLKFGLGALVSYNFVGRDLSAVYGGDRTGTMGFLRLKVE